MKVVKSSTERAVQIVTARGARSVQTLSQNTAELRRMPGRTIPVAVGVLSLFIGIGGIILAGTQLPKLRPPPEVIIVKVPAPAPEPKPVNSAEPKRIAAPEIEPKPAVEEAAAPTQPAPAKIAAVEQPRDDMAVRRLPQAQAAAPEMAVEEPVKANPGEFERIEARPPLSEFYTPEAQKPVIKPPPDEKWRMTRMFNPVANAAGRIEVKGHRLALAGLEPLGVGERCTWNGVDWPCGTVARTAFRQWLRARAVQCKVPPTPKSEEITSECQVGKADIGEWLVSRGWARSVPGGPYAEYEKWAKTSRIGIYGAPPRRVSVRVNPQSAGLGPDVINLDLPESTPDELNQEPTAGAGLGPEIVP